MFCRISLSLNAKVEMNSTNSTGDGIRDPFIMLNLIMEPILYICAILGNSITIAAIWSHRDLRRFQNAIIVSLAVADFLVGFIGLVLWLFLQGITISTDFTSGSDFLYNLVALLQSTPMTASVLHLIALGVERSIAVFLPLRFNVIVTATFMKVILSTTWIVAFVFMFTSLSTMLLKDPVKRVRAYLMYMTILTYTLYFMVLISLVTMSVKTLIIVRKKVQVVPGQTLQQKKYSSMLKATRRFTLILVAYVATYTPMTVVALLLMSPDNASIYSIFPLCKNVALSNSCVNIIVYCISSKKYRSAYVRLIQNMYDCVKRPI